MTVLESNLSACARCQKWDRPAPGVILCSANGKAIGCNANANACPLDLFLPPGAKCVRCHSPAHDVAACPIPPEFAATPESAVSGGCGCSPPPVP